MSQERVSDDAQHSGHSSSHLSFSSSLSQYNLGGYWFCYDSEDLTHPLSFVANGSANDGGAEPQPAAPQPTTVSLTPPPAAEGNTAAEQPSETGNAPPLYCNDASAAHEVHNESRSFANSCPPSTAEEEARVRSTTRGTSSERAYNSASDYPFCRSGSPPRVVHNHNLFGQVQRVSLPTNAVTPTPPTGTSESAHVQHRRLLASVATARVTNVPPTLPRIPREEPVRYEVVQEKSMSFNTAVEAFVMPKVTIVVEQASEPKSPSPRHPPIQRPEPVVLDGDDHHPTDHAAATGATPTAQTEGSAQTTVTVSAPSQVTTPRREFVVADTANVPAQSLTPHPPSPLRAHEEASPRADGPLMPVVAMMSAHDLTASPPPPPPPMPIFSATSPSHAMHARRQDSANRRVTPLRQRHLTVSAVTQPSLQPRPHPSHTTPVVSASWSPLQAQPAELDTAEAEAGAPSVNTHVVPEWLQRVHRHIVATRWFDAAKRGSGGSGSGGGEAAGSSNSNSSGASGGSRAAQARGDESGTTPFSKPPKYRRITPSPLRANLLRPATYRILSDAAAVTAGVANVGVSSDSSSNLRSSSGHSKGQLQSVDGSYQSTENGFVSIRHHQRPLTPLSQREEWSFLSAHSVAAPQLMAGEGGSRDGTSATQMAIIAPPLHAPPRRTVQSLAALHAGAADSTASSLSSVTSSTGEAELVDTSGRRRHGQQPGQSLRHQPRHRTLSDGAGSMLLPRAPTAATVPQECPPNADVRGPAEGRDGQDGEVRQEAEQPSPMAEQTGYCRTSTLLSLTSTELREMPVVYAAPLDPTARPTPGRGAMRPDGAGQSLQYDELPDSDSGASTRRPRQQNYFSSMKRRQQRQQQQQQQQSRSGSRPRSEHTHSTTESSGRSGKSQDDVAEEHTQQRGSPRTRQRRLSGDVLMLDEGLVSVTHERTVAGAHLAHRSSPSLVFSATEASISHEPSEREGAGVDGVMGVAGGAPASLLTANATAAAAATSPHDDADSTSTSARAESPPSTSYPSGVSLPARSSFIGRHGP